MKTKVKAPRELSPAEKAAKESDRLDHIYWQVIDQVVATIMARGQTEKGKL
jgi:hypothetical protein